MSEQVGVLIVDDSAVIRRALTAHLEEQPGIHVLGAAPDPYVARDMMAELSPDVLILDIQMPRMDGLAFLKKLKKYHPVPTIVVSSLAESATSLAIECLEHGAIEVLQKPSESCSINELAARLANIIRNVPGMQVKLTETTTDDIDEPPEVESHDGPLDPDRIIAIGSSTGGTEALRAVLTPLPKNTPPIVMAQHMPAGFTNSFAARLDGLCNIEVIEANNGDRAIPGRAILAPGDRHLRLVKDKDGYFVRVVDGPRVCRHKPSVEVLFRSVASVAGPNAMGIILTGMGDDGADGLVAMRQAGAFTVGQDAETCVVYGMPKAAYERGGVERVAALNKIPASIMAFTRRKTKSEKAA